MKKKYSGRGYITKEYPAPKSLYDYFWSLTDNLKHTRNNQDIAILRQKYHEFLCHLYVSMIARLKSKENRAYGNVSTYIPISSKLIYQAFTRNFDFRQLSNMGLINFKYHIIPYPGQKGESREYKLEDTVFQTAQQIEAEFVLPVWKLMLSGDSKPFKLVNLMNGKKKQFKKKSLITKKKKGTLYNHNPSPLIKKALKLFSPCPFIPDKPYWHVLKLQRLAKKSTKICTKIKMTHGLIDDLYHEAYRNYQKAYGIYLNGFSTLKTILYQKPEKIVIKDKMLFQYDTAYIVQDTGRIGEISGGFQGASQLLKERFLPGDNIIFNYDLKASQANILLQEFNAYGIKSDWLENYLNNSNLKNEYSKQIGITEDLWKSSFYAVIMGAEPENPFSTVLANFHSYFNTTSKAITAFKKFKKLISQLLKSTDKWRSYLLFDEKCPYRYQHAGMIYWKNACGMRFKKYGLKFINGKPCVLDMQDNCKVKTHYKSLRKVKRYLASFILQGQESSFIHHLTILCANNGIPVFKNEHDGLITGDMIPNRIIEEASKNSGLKNCTFQIKPICSSEKKENWRNFKKQFKKLHKSIYTRYGDERGKLLTQMEPYVK